MYSRNGEKDKIHKKCRSTVIGNLKSYRGTKITVRIHLLKLTNANNFSTKSSKVLILIDFNSHYSVHL